ncbi:hypothetical protein YC2023_010551 [Brassica napus]
MLYGERNDMRHGGTPITAVSLAKQVDRQSTRSQGVVLNSTPKFHTLKSTTSSYIKALSTKPKHYLTTRSHMCIMSTVHPKCQIVGPPQWVRGATKVLQCGSDHYSDVVVIATPYPTSKGKLEDKFAANIMMVRASSCLMTTKTELARAFVTEQFVLDLCKKGVKAFIETDLEGLTKYEAKCLNYLKEHIIEDTEKEIKFAESTLEA